MENIYLHGINHQNASFFNEKDDLEILEEILASSYILSRKLQNKTSSNGCLGFNGTEYISLCDYDLRNAPLYNNNTIYHSYNAYRIFIRQLISIIINKEKIEVIKPIIVDPIETTIHDIETLKRKGKILNSCYTDLPDEVQVKDRVSLDFMKGITIPFYYFKKLFINYDRDYDIALKKAINLINKIDELLNKYKRNNKIYSLEDFQEIKSTNDIEKTLKKVIAQQTIE